MLVDNEEELFEKCVEDLKSWKTLITKYLDEDEQIEEVEKLKNVVQGICEIDEKFKRNQRAIEKVDNYLDQMEDPGDVNIDNLFEEMLSSEPASSANDLTSYPIWQTIFESDADLMVVEQKKLKQLDASQFEEIDESLLCSNVFTPPVDPMSKTVIKNPYKNKVCKHVYEHSTILSYIKQLRHKAKCPYIGCKNVHLRANDLVEDRQLQTQITQYLTEQVSQSSDSDNY